MVEGAEAEAEDGCKGEGVCDACRLVAEGPDGCEGRRGGEAV